MADPAYEIIGADRPARWLITCDQASNHVPGDAVDRHALQTGRANVLIERRQDLISDASGQLGWASRLAPMLTDVLNGNDF